jgi:hypothetical protein
VGINQSISFSAMPSHQNKALLPYSISPIVQAIPDKNV